MPTYDYECTKCGHLFEVFQSMTAEKIKKCPECKGKVNRLIGTGAGLLFKGGGFYETDYRSDGYKEAQKKDTDSQKAAAEKKSGGEKKSDGSEKKSSESTTAKAESGKGKTGGQEGKAPVRKKATRKKATGSKTTGSKAAKKSGRASGKSS